MKYSLSFSWIHLYPFNFYYKLLITAFVILLLFSLFIYLVNLVYLKLNLFLSFFFTEDKSGRVEISQEIHKGISGDLASIRIFLSILQRNSSTTDKEEIYSTLFELLNQATNNIDIISNKIIPHSLITGDLQLAISKYCFAIDSPIDFNIYRCNRQSLFNYNSADSYNLYNLIIQHSRFRIEHGQITYYHIVFENNGNITILDNGLKYSLSYNSLDVKYINLTSALYRAKVVNLNIRIYRIKNINKFIITKKNNYA